jgi:hypothetical protein
MKILKDLIMMTSILTMLAIPAIALPANAYAASEVCANTNNAKGAVDQLKVNKCLNQSPVVHDIQTIVNFLSAAVGVVIIAMLIVGGIQYSMAGDNASALTAARQRITNAVIALVAFLFAFAFLQWLIPGGIF